MAAKAWSEGIKTNPEDLAIDEIMDVGPRGHFLIKKSTQKNLRKLWDPGIAHQWSPENGDFRDPHEVAIEKIQWILENHKPKPLDEKVKKEMSKIIKLAEEELSKGGVN
jgi:trimethylamine--corrinoid protein Co-methyltransferase